MLRTVAEYRPQAEDVSEAVDRAVFDGFRQMTPQQRLQIAMQACRSLQRLAIAGLRLRFPQADDEELFRRAGALRLGPELTRWAFGPAAEAWIQ